MMDFGSIETATLEQYDEIMKVNTRYMYMQHAYGY
jgi:hypothetical protein